MRKNQNLNQSMESMRKHTNDAVVYPEILDNQKKVYNKEKKRARNQGLSHLYQNDYKPAVYKKAVQFKNSMSYKKKIGQNEYKQIGLFQDTQQLKAFGLGPYFFIQFQRRMVWLYLVATCLIAITIIINSKGTGLQDYKASFSTYLIKTTIGNFNQNNALTKFDIYIVAIAPFAVYLAFFVFYLLWKCHYFNAIKQQDQSKQFVKPQKFCVEVQGFKDLKDIRQDDLEQFYSSFGPVYEVCLARQYEGNLKYFEQLDCLEQEIKQQELQIILGSGDKDNLKQLKRQKEQLSKYINKLKIKPSLKSAYIHYQFQKSKVDMLQYYSDHYLFGHKWSHAIARSICCCCIDEPDQKHLFRGQKLVVRQQKVPEPEDINWDSYQVSFCGKIIRVLLSICIVLIFLAISCTIIGLCSVYISSHSVSCQGILIPNTVGQAQSLNQNAQQKKCFCNANFVQSFNNQQIQVYCGDLLNQVYTEQAIQYAITATAAIVNIFFGIIVQKIVNLTVPQSLSIAYLWKTTIHSIFLIFNTVLLPLLIYADIFGFKATNYVSFITIISTDISMFFQVDNIKLYTDFEKIWYRNVSPIFVNYIVLDIIITWVFYILYKCCCTKENLQSEQGITLQKNMNQKIISWRLNASDQLAMFILIIFMSMFYGCGVPVLVPLAFVNLFSKYLTNRSLLQNLSSRVEGLSQALTSFTMFIIPIIIVFSCLVGSWMLTANSSISQFTQLKINLNIDMQILQRQLTIPFYIILALVVVFQFFFYNTIIRFCGWLSQSCHDRKQVVHPYYTREYSFYVKSMSIMHSYNIRNNIKYKNAIINMEKYLAKNQIKE